MHSHKKVIVIALASFSIAAICGFLEEGHFVLAHLLRVGSEIGTLSAAAAIAMLFGGEV